MSEYPAEDEHALAEVGQAIADFAGGGSPQLLVSAAELMINHPWHLYIDKNRTIVTRELADELLAIGARYSQVGALETGLAVVNAELGRIPDRLDVFGEATVRSMRGALLAERYYQTQRLDDLSAALDDLNTVSSLVDLPGLLDDQTKAWYWWTYAHTLGTQADLTRRLDHRAAALDALARGAQVRGASPRWTLTIRAAYALALVEYWERASLTEPDAPAKLPQAYDTAIAEYVELVELPDADDRARATWLQNLVRFMRRRTDLDDDPGRLDDTGLLDDTSLLDYAERALRLIPGWDADRARAVAVKAEVLHRRAVRSNDPGDRRAADDAIRDAYEVSIEFGGDVLHIAAANWANRCAALGDWAGAAEAGEHALAAMEDLVRRQVQIDNKRVVLRRAIAIAGTTADALCRAERAGEAATVLERGQAMVLVDQYARPALVADFLTRAGHRELADEYLELADVARRFDASDPDLRAAQQDLTDFLANLPDIPGLGPLTGGATDPVGLLAGLPAVYLAAGLALVLDGSGGVIEVRLPELTEDRIWRHATRFANRVVAAANPVDLRIATIEATCRWLGEAVIAPLEPALRGFDRVTLIPTGGLAGLPLHATGTPAAPRVYTYLPAAALAPPVVARVDPEISVLAVADPDRGDASQLSGTRREADLIRQAFPGTRTLVREEATRERVRSALGKARLLHFGCHAAADSHDVLDSSLLLAGSDQLTLRELLAQRADLADAVLVVLSACQTNAVDVRLPSEATNLSTGVLAAGAQAVIGSLWPVPDDATAVLMRHFYRSIRDGTGPARALWEAQQAVASQPGWVDRYYWAGFVYLGR